MSFPRLRPASPARFMPGRPALPILVAFLALAGAPAAAEEPATAPAEGRYVAFACPIEGQGGAVVLGSGGDFQAACLALSRPSDPGPWTAADVERVDGSSRFCPRPVLSVLDRSGAVTIRFLPAEGDSFLADPTTCCRANAIAVDPENGMVRIATDGPVRDCFGGTASAASQDLYRWDGSELTFLENQQREGDAPPR